MSLSDIAAIGGLLSSVAVCGSLVYLALQVRQSDRNQRSLMVQGISTRGSDNIMFMAQPHISVLLGRLTQGETDFSQTEMMQLNLMLRLVLSNVQDTYFQHKAGLADELSFDGAKSIARLFLGFPLMRVLWQGARPTFPAEMARLVDGLADDLPLAAPVDLQATVKHGLAQLEMLDS
jgi:hypothetical protein